jgi:hypothetical protein
MTAALLPDPLTVDPLTVDLATALSTRDLETQLLSLAGHLAAAQCRFLLLLAEFDRRDGWAGPGLKSCAHWLCWRIGMNLRTATEHVRVAHALTTLPKITEAFAAGRISYSKVRAITRITGKPTPDPPDPPDHSPDHRGTGSDDLGNNLVDDTQHDNPDSVGPSRGMPDLHDGNASGGDRWADDTGGPADPPADPPTSEPPPGPASPTSPTGQPAQAEIPSLADDAEQVLLDLALTSTASHVETIVRATRRARTNPTRHTALRALTWHYDDDGSLILRGRFTPTTAPTSSPPSTR